MRKFYALFMTTLFTVVCSMAFAQTTYNVELASEVPTIDGYAFDGAWTSIVADSINNELSGADGVSFATFKACYDATNLYLLFEITDDIIFDVAFYSVPQWYIGDGLEFFVDMTNSKEAIDVNDSSTVAPAIPSSPGTYQFRWLNNLDTLTNFEEIPSALDKASVSSLSGTGYAIEVALAWADLLPSFTPTEGTSFGVEMQYTDQDGPVAGWAPDAAFLWNHTEEANKKLSSSFGTFTLGAGGTTTGVDVEEATVLVAPVPADDQITIAAEVASVTVLDMAGQVVATATTSTVDVSTLIPGVYVLNIVTADGQAIVKKIVVE